MQEIDPQYVLKLKLRVNAQVDKIEELEKALEESGFECKEKDKKIQELLAEKSQNVIQDINQYSEVEIKAEDPFMECARVLKFVLKEIPDKKIFIKYKNDCQNAREFNKVSKPELDSFIGDLISKNNFDNFFVFCNALGVIRSDKSGKYIFIDPQNRKFYMFKKKAFEYMKEVES